MEGDDLTINFPGQPLTQYTRPYQKKAIAALAKAYEWASPGEEFVVSVATGGGKTRIANDWLMKDLIPSKKSVLWVAPNRRLLWQAASDLCRRYKAAHGLIGRIGCEGTLDEFPEDWGAKVVFATVGQLHSLLQGRRPSALRPDVVIVDEVHWGENATMDIHRYNKLRKISVFVGLTATPRSNTDFEEVYAKPFSELVEEGWLAEPNLRKVNTGIKWSPKRAGRNGDWNSTSLGNLGKDARRTKTVVNTWLKGRKEYGKTVIFAIDIEHAHAIHSQLCAKGVRASIITTEHCNQKETQEAIEAFHRGQVDVLVNVKKAIHGVDVPDIKSIFLARPTASKILFMQMVGRGARKSPGETTFNVMDFVDNLTRHKDALITADGYYGEIQRPPFVQRQKGKRAPKIASHGFSPEGFELYFSEGCDQTIHGFELQPSQTFGVELEVTRKGFRAGKKMPRDWMRVANLLLDCARKVVGKKYAASKPLPVYHSESKDFSVWNVEWDSSCGWELVSRVLVGHEGIQELFEVCEALTRCIDDLGLEVNKKTGTHIHLGWGPEVPELKRLFHLCANYQPALYSLVSPSRVSNSFCLPVTDALSLVEQVSNASDLEDVLDLDDGPGRYLFLNDLNLASDIKTVEVRLHHGTTAGQKIVAWLSLWMRILDAARNYRSIEQLPPRHLTSNHPLLYGNGGDVLHLMNLISPTAPNVMLRYFNERRLHLLNHSWRHSQKFGSGRLLDRLEKKLAA